MNPSGPANLAARLSSLIFLSQGSRAGNRDVIPNQANGFARGPVVEDHRVMTQSQGSSARCMGLVAETGKDMTAYFDLGDLNPYAAELRYGLEDEQGVQQQGVACAEVCRHRQG